MTTVPSHFAVAGFGIGGAFLAARLAALGHRVTVFEQAPRCEPIGAGILLQPSGQRVLQSHGLLEAVIARAEPIEEVIARTTKGRTLVHLPYACVGDGRRAYGVHRGALFEVLRRRCEELGVVPDTAHQVAGRRIQRDGVYVELADRDPRGPFDALLVTDGRGSRLRRILDWQLYTHEYQHGALWTVGRSNAVRGRLLQTVEGTRHLIGLLPTGDDTCSYFGLLDARRRDEVMRRGLPAYRDEILPRCPEAEELLDSVTDMSAFTFTTYSHVWMRRWHDAHTLFLADAAHAMSPHLGQGANFALLDGDAFADAVEQAPDFPSACRLYCKRRAASLLRYSTLTLGLTPFFQSAGVVKAVLRDLVLPNMVRVPFLQREMVRWMSGDR